MKREDYVIEEDCFSASTLRSIRRHIQLQSVDDALKYDGSCVVRIRDFCVWTIHVYVDSLGIPFAVLSKFKPGCH